MQVTAIPKVVSEQLKLVKSGGEGERLEIVRMDTVEAEDVRWLWHPFIARGKLTGFTGEAGIGKSWITCALASVASRGGWFPNCPESPSEPANVLFLASEDGLRDTLKPRLDSVRADQSRVFTVQNHFAFDTVGFLRFENLISEIRPALVIIDPFFSYLSGGLNINLATEIRPVTSRLAAIAESYDAAFLLVRHVGKARGMGEARAAGLGSIDFRAVCRSEMLIGKNPDNTQEGAIVQIKNNLEEYGKPVGYEIKDGQIFFKETNLTAQKILSGTKNEDEREAQSEAVAFLRELFSKEAELEANLAIKQAESLGITKPMLRTARAKLNVECIKRGNAFGKNSKWYWRVKETSSQEGV